jgi:hypothetical protein
MSTSALVDIITVPGDVDRRNREWLHAHAAVGVSTLSDGNPALAVTVNF